MAIPVHIPLPFPAFEIFGDILMAAVRAGQTRSPPCFPEHLCGDIIVSKQYNQG